VLAGFTSAGFASEPFGKVGFGFAVSAGFASEPFGKVGFGFEVLACFFSAGLTS
jgi:hypothetical protein